MSTVNSEYEQAMLLLDKPGRSGSRTRLIQARRHLERAIARRPKHAAAQAALGYTNDQLGRRGEEALACFRRAAIADAAERIREAREPGRAQRGAEAERKACREDQQALARRFDPSRVPAAVRILAPWASRYGVGDDVCRPRRLMRLTKARRAKLIHAVDAHTPGIQAGSTAFRAGR